MHYHRNYASLVAAFVISGCATTIPEVDTNAPEIRLTITGPGIGRRAMSNPPLEVWVGAGDIQYIDLAPSTEYSFVLSVSDPGGVARVYFRMPTELTLVEYAPGTVVAGTAGTSQSLTLNGTRGDPRTGLLISGTFRTWDRSGVLNFTFDVDASDFGGSSGSPNSRSLQVESAVGARTP